MNYNIIAVISSYLPLKEVSNLLEYCNFDNDVRETVILHLAYIYKTNYYTMNGFINNCHYRCAGCNQQLNGDYCIRQAYIDCQKCQEKKNFNLDICNNCIGFKIKRGEIKIIGCDGGHNILYLGVNLMSY